MPTKSQFDKLALDWLDGVSDVDAAVNPETVKQTYRLTFDHCTAGNCKRACTANPRCLSGLNGAGLTNSLDKAMSAEVPASGARLDVPAGLRNLGATCYVNSLLQVWFHDKEFRRLILKWDRNIDSGESDSAPTVPQTIIGHLQLLFARLLKSPKSTVDPTAFVEFLGLDIEYQQDASELADLLFTRIVEQLRAYPDQSLASDLEEVYRGELTNVVECQTCGNARRSRDVFFRLNLNIQGVRSVQQCLRALGQKKNMDCEFRCYGCLGTGGAASYEEIVALPPVLNLQLQRYRFDIKAGTRKKIKATVRFPPKLDMAPFVQGASSPLIYDLKAVLVHIGQTATSGHYIANVKVTMPHKEGNTASATTPRWFRLNDETVSESKGRAEFDKELSTENNAQSNGQKTEAVNGQSSDGSEASSDEFPVLDSRIGSLDNQSSDRKNAESDGEGRPRTTKNSTLMKAEKDNDKAERVGSTGAKNGDNRIGPGRNPAGKGVTRPSKKSQSVSERAEKNGADDRKSTPVADDEDSKGAKQGNELSSTGAYLLVYERRRRESALSGAQDMAGEDVKKKTVVDDSPLLGYLQAIIDNEAAEFASLEAEAAAVRSKAASQVRQLRLELAKVSRRLVFVPEEGKRPQFVETSFLVSWIKATRELIKKLNLEQTAVHTTSSETKAGIEESVAPSAERKVKGRKKKTSSTSSELQMDGVEEDDDDAEDSASFVRCPHGRLAPDATGLKVISTDGANLLKELCLKHHLVEADLLRQQDVPQELCRDCVVGLARRSLLATQLAVDKKNFAKLIRAKDQSMYWVGSRALQSWDKMVERRLTRELGLRMNETEETLNGELVCEHGGLGLKSRKQIPKDAWLLLKQYFPDGAEFPSDHPDCAQCMEESEEALAAQAERMGTASGLRSRLGGLMKMRRTFEAENLKGLLLQADQADVLRRFLRYPRGPRPNGLRNKLLCRHGGCLIDHPALVPGGLLPEEVVVLSAHEWDTLCTEFGVSGALEVTRELGEPGEPVLLSYKPAMCQACVAEVQSNAEQAALSFQNAWITVQLVPLEELLLNKVLPTRSEDLTENAEVRPLLRSGDQPTSEAAATKRPLLGRGKRVKGNRLLQISSNNKFVDLKVKLMTSFNVSPLLQVIVVDGHIVEADGDVLLKDIGLRPGSVVYVAEQTEEAGERDDDQEPSKKRTKKVEHGFAGTKLMG
ncbi:ubiquitin carboxyl-terminal hydrolase 48-like [Tropilaelaps mercedesae]|uniref:ubiquitinyl hydrolase 1 n=1 Tax=Tropilaelaps mercedesae TaxID=418985 RepID=A0A1V9XGA2_9ACAR|nr:ubiquitin carboxyl-terminal hydrolase 48-like [Tropilaelaps mercedesae]